MQLNVVFIFRQQYLTGRGLLPMPGVNAVFLVNREKMKTAAGNQQMRTVYTLLIADCRDFIIRMQCSPSLRENRRERRLLQRQRLCEPGDFVRSGPCRLHSCLCSLQCR